MTPLFKPALAAVLALGLGACTGTKRPLTYRCTAEHPDCPPELVCQQGWCVEPADQGADSAADALSPLDGPAADADRPDAAVPDAGVADAPMPDLTPDTAAPADSTVAADAPWPDALPVLVDAAPADAPAADAPWPDAAPLPDSAPADSGSGTVPNYVTIPAGSFTMGSPTGELCHGSSPYGDSLETQHPVTLVSPFELQSTEVTQVQFKQLMGYDPSGYTSCGASCPVDNVRWHDAAAYANALSAQAGLTQCYSCSGSGAGQLCSEAPAYSGSAIYACPGYRLPTEAEWEYAYRAGSSTSSYAGDFTSCGPSDPLADQVAWYNLASTGFKTHPVALKQPNSWGLYDMAGNLWEWCHDWFQADLGANSTVNPWGPAAGSDRVARGGAFSVGPNWLRAACRHHDTPSLVNKSFGFRVGRSRSIVAPDSCPVGGHAASFDGDDYILLPPSADLKFGTQAFTIELWVRGKGTTLYGVPFGANWASSTGVGFQIYSDGELVFNGALSGTGFGVVSSQKINATHWYHLAGVRDPSAGVAILYLNGVEVGRATDALAPLDSPGGYMIGDRESATRPWLGEVDEVRVWKTARTAAQIKANMLTTVPPTSPGLVAYYQLDQTSGQLAPDATGRGNDGQLGSSTAADSADPSWTSCPLCAPGATQSCACSSGGTGSQSCAPDGSAWSPCSCSSCTTSFADDFEDGDAAGWSVTSWGPWTGNVSWDVVSVAGGYSYQGTGGSPTGGGNSISSAQGFAAATDYYIEADLTNIAQFHATAGAGGLVARFTDSDNYYVCYLTPSTAILGKYYNGPTAGPLDTATISFPVGAKAHVRLQVDGSNISCDVDGVLLQATDTSLTAGTFGLLNWGGTTAFDNVSVGCP